MRVAINTLSVDRKKGGIRIFLLGAIDGLARVRPAWKIVLLCSAANLDLFTRFPSLYSNVRIKVLRSVGDGVAARILSDQLLVSRALGGFDVLLTPSNIATFCTDIPQVVVIQAPLALKNIRELPYVPRGLVPGARGLYYDWALPLTMKRANRVVAVSQFLADRLIELFPDDSAKVTVVEEGASVAQVDHGHEHREPYLLFVSNLYPYKNADCLIKALGILRRGTHESLALKICGWDLDGKQIDRLRGIAVDAGVADSVEFLGQVPHSKLFDLYKKAQAFVYPSCVETFGLPVLESMACGTPVICSDKMSVPEVAGDAALIVDPFDIEAMAVAIGRALTDDGLAQRMIEAGYERVRHFTWERCAEGLATQLEIAAAQKRTS